MNIKNESLYLTNAYLIKYENMKNMKNKNNPYKTNAEILFLKKNFKKGLVLRIIFFKYVITKIGKIKIIDNKNGIIVKIKSKFILLKFKFEKIKFINPNLKLKVLINKFISRKMKNPKTKGNILKLSSKIEFSKFILFSFPSISFLV